MGWPKGKPRPEADRKKISAHHRNNYWNLLTTKEDQVHLAAFKRMHDRVRDFKVPSIAWPRDIHGFIAFKKHIGPVPEEMEKPSVGRINHSLGYQPGNVIWQEHKLNSILRKGTRHECYAY